MWIFVNKIDYIILYNLNIKNEPLIIFIQHPVSNWLKTTKKNFKTTLHAIDELNLPTIIIGPNSDPGNLAMKLQYLKFKFSNKKTGSGLPGPKG